MSNVLKRFFSSKNITKLTEPCGEYIYGAHAVYSALINNKRKYYYQLFAIKNCETNNTHKNHEIIDLCISMNIPIEYFTKAKLSKLISLHRHGGFILDCDPIIFPNIDTYPIIFVNNSQQIWVCLNSLKNQDNIGNIFRNCLFFGINGVLYTKFESAPLSPIVARTSCGSLDFLDVRLCDNMTQYLSKVFYFY